jgi:hypothetical protein
LSSYSPPPLLVAGVVAGLTYKAKVVEHLLNQFHPSDLLTVMHNILLFHRLLDSNPGFRKRSQLMFLLYSLVVAARALVGVDVLSPPPPPGLLKSSGDACRIHLEET